jgi:CspA family cold shock protein
MNKNKATRGTRAMPTGHVKWFNNAKGYGFIVVEGSDKDYFAHFSSIKMEGFRTLKAGQSLVFEALETDKGAHAINIEPQPFDPPVVDTKTVDTKKVDPKTIATKAVDPKAVDSSKVASQKMVHAVNDMVYSDSTT